MTEEVDRTVGRAQPPIGREKTRTEDDRPANRREIRRSPIREAPHAFRGDEVPALSARRPARPHMAGKADREGAGLVLRRPARRQPGAGRPDGARPQGPHVPAAPRHGLQGNRDRLPVRLADGFRLRPVVHRGRQRSRRRFAAGARPVPAGADQANLRGARGRAPADRPFLQFHLGTPAPRRLRQGRRGHPADRRRRRQDDHRHGGCFGGRQGRLPVRVFARELHRHRAGSGAGHLQRRHRGSPADA